MSKIELATAFVQYTLSINIHVLETSTHFIFLSAIIDVIPEVCFGLYPTTRAQNEDRCCREARDILQNNRHAVAMICLCLYCAYRGNVFGLFNLPFRKV